MTQEDKNQILSTEYPIMELFYSIQGEGYHSGEPAFFIRLAGCDVGCVWCDVKESWDANAHPSQTVSKIIEEIEDSGAKNVVITGGEPSLHDLTALNKALKLKGLNTWIETAGTNNIDTDIDWVCFSPKKFKKPSDSIYKIANELKIVVFNNHDLEWAETHANKVNDDCVLLLQPEWEREEDSLPMIINYVKRNPKWRISLQTHKYMNVR